jgi:ribosome-binding protein aMBF1 (putative translation factor)
MDCFKCGKSEQEVRLFDAVIDTGVVKMCEQCAEDDGIPVIRRPSTAQLKESEKPYTVQQRLRRMAGLNKEEQDKISEIAKRVTNVTLDDLRRRKLEKEQAEKDKQERKQPIQLIDNYNWHITMARKKRRMTRKELARELGESETAIRMIEEKQLPEDAILLIKKLEQFFGKRFREGVENRAELIESEETSPELEISEAELGPEEPEQSGKEQALILEKKKGRGPSTVLKFDRQSVGNLTIGDLVKMKEEKERKEREKLEAIKERHGKLEIDDLITQVREDEKDKIVEQQEQSGLLGDDIEFEE